MTRPDVICIVCKYPKVKAKPCPHCAERRDQIRREAAERAPANKKTRRKPR